MYRVGVYKQLKNFIQTVVLRPCLILLYRLLSLFVKTDQDLVLFVLIENYFYDNSRFLSEYMIENKRGKVTFLVKSEKVHNELIEKGFRSYLFKSFDGFFLFLKSQKIVISYGTSFIEFFPYYLNHKQKDIVYLGHGIPMKRIGMQLGRYQHNRNRRLLQSYSYGTCCSEIERFILNDAFRIGLDNIWLTDMARNDYLVDSSRWDLSLKPKHPYLNKKVILYAPTWRESEEGIRFFPFDDFCIDQLRAFLKEQDAVILFRSHKEDLKRGDVDLSIFENDGLFHFAGQDVFPDVIELLPFVDLLITDYSGIMFDFLTLNRPMVFIPYDLDDYMKYKGVLFDYSKLSPGKIVGSQKEFLLSIGAYLSNPLEDQILREKVRNTMFEKLDANACRRIANKIMSLEK